jgi:hypothetical protein
VIQLLTMLIMLGAIIWAFFSPLWAWAPLFVMAGLAFAMRLSQEKRDLVYVDELSPQANVMLRKYWHFYAMPFAGSDFSASTSTIQGAAVIVGIIGAFKGFWWGLLGAAALWLLLSHLAMWFNPSNFIRGTDLEAPHNEIISWLQARARLREEEIANKQRGPESSTRD